MVCPWWLGFALDNPLRRLFHDPGIILGPYVRAGNSVIDVGAGTGFFSIPLAGMVGPAGRVTAIDIQPEMLAALARKARKRGVSQVIKPHLASRVSLGNHYGADFILAFWVVHEVPDQRVLFEELNSFLKPGGQLLLVEPLVHVSEKSFLRTIGIAEESGFAFKGTPKVRLSRSMLLARKTVTG